jgi:hypothetical protein
MLGNTATDCEPEGVYYSAVLAVYIREVSCRRTCMLGFRSGPIYSRDELSSIK